MTKLFRPRDAKLDQHRQINKCTYKTDLRPETTGELSVKWFFLGGHIV